MMHKKHIIELNKNVVKIILELVIILKYYSLLFRSRTLDEIIIQMIIFEHSSFNQNYSYDVLTTYSLSSPPQDLKD